MSQKKVTDVDKKLEETTKTAAEIKTNSDQQVKTGKCG